MAIGKKKILLLVLVLIAVLLYYYKDEIIPFLNKKLGLKIASGKKCTMQSRLRENTEQQTMEYLGVEVDCNSYYDNNGNLVVIPFVNDPSKIQ